MSKISIAGASTGTATFTIESPATSTNRTITIPDATTTLVGTDATQTLTNKTLTTPNINSAQVDTVSGTAPLYFARAWVKFSGEPTVSIFESGNVSSVTDNGTGDYTVNFTTAMPDANYAAVASAESRTVGGNSGYSTSSLTLKVRRSDNFALADQEVINVAVFR